MTSPQILDACVVINLLASDEIDAILRAAGRKSFICSVVEKESIYLRTDDASAPVERIDLRHLIESGLLTVCSVEGDKELRLYVDYASVLSDGEAMSLAIAQSRDYLLVTDEKKTRRLFLETAGKPMQMSSTSALLREWAEKDISVLRLKQALSNVERRARYQPSPNDSNHRWWLASSR